MGGDFQASLYNSNAVLLSAILGFQPKFWTKYSEALILPQRAFNISTKVPKQRKQMEHAIKFFQYSILRSTIITRALDWLLIEKSKHVFTYLTASSLFGGVESN